MHLTKKHYAVRFFQDVGDNFIRHSPQFPHLPEMCDTLNELFPPRAPDMGDNFGRPLPHPHPTRHWRYFKRHSPQTPQQIWAIMSVDLIPNPTPLPQSVISST